MAGLLAAPIADDNACALISSSGPVTVTGSRQFALMLGDGSGAVIGGTERPFDAGTAAPTTSLARYDGPSGTFPFQRVSGECCSGAGVLQVSLSFENAPAPGPEQAARLCGGLPVVAIRVHRIQRRAVA